MIADEAVQLFGEAVSCEQFHSKPRHLLAATAPAQPPHPVLARALRSRACDAEQLREELAARGGVLRERAVQHVACLGRRQRRGGGAALGIERRPAPRSPQQQSKTGS